MNKILRYSFIALLAMVFGNVMAEDVFVSDFSYATGEKFTGGGDGTFTGSVATCFWISLIYKHMFDLLFYLYHSLAPMKSASEMSWASPV